MGLKFLNCAKVGVGATCTLYKGVGKAVLAVTKRDMAGRLETEPDMEFGSVREAKQVRASMVVE